MEAKQATRTAMKEKQQAVSKHELFKFMAAFKPTRPASKYEGERARKFLPFLAVGFGTQESEVQILSSELPASTEGC